PPEAFNGGEIDARSDVWAFGVMLFEMLTGHRPFTGETLLQVLSAITTQPIPDLERLRPDVPIALVDLIYRMLIKDREARISSARLIGAELESISQGARLGAAFVGEKQTVFGTVRFATPTPTASAPRQNLPTQTTPFVGRETELVEL